MRRKRICNVTQDGQIVFTGTYAEIAEWLNTTEDAVRSGANHRRMFQFKYWVDYAGWISDKAEKEKTKKKKLTKHELELKYLVEKLNLYGNTILNTNPEKYMKELNEQGIFITYHESWDGKIIDGLLSPRGRNKKDIYYVLEKET